MLNSSEPKIRVDQSHCNYQLSIHLDTEGWKILFRDPGRVSRGSSGTQATVLGIFEKSGLPIPDIAAVKDGYLLLIEVDKSARNNNGSFATYQEQAKKIIAAFNQVNLDIGILDKLLVGFCKVGREKSSQNLINIYNLDLVASFEDAFTPITHWRLF